MDENKRGGRRKGAGRKPISNSIKKKQITLYVPEVDIWKFGNNEKMKVELYEFIENYRKNIPESFKENGGLLRLGKEPSEAVTIKIDQNSYYKPQEKSFQQHMNDLSELEYEDEYRKKAAEIQAATNLSPKQKDLLLINMKKSNL